jgi:hypothetical protein
VILSYPSDTTEDMDCCCDACLDILHTPPADYLDPIETRYEMAWDACWQDMADPIDPRDYL